MTQTIKGKAKKVEKEATWIEDKLEELVERVSARPQLRRGHFILPNEFLKPSYNGSVRRLLPPRVA